MCPNLKRSISKYRKLSRDMRVVTKVLHSVKRRSLGRVLTVRQSTGTRVGVLVHDAACPPDQVPVLWANMETSWVSMGAVALRRLDRLPPWTQGEAVCEALKRFRPVK